MEQLVKFDGTIEQQSIPLSGKTVQARSLLRIGEAENATVIFVRHEEKTYPVTLNAQIPTECVLERDSQGQVCGIPAVTGG